jgi:rubrerythrin
LATLLNQHYSTKWNPEISFEDDLLSIQRNVYMNRKEKSLQNINPELAEEWDNERNQGVTPEQVTSASDFKAHWICKNCGFKWKSPIGSRARGHGCPFCSGKALRTGYNDLATKYPELLKEWNYEKNEITPDSVTAMSDRKVWWHCDRCGQDYLKRIADKSKGTGCPVCAGKVIVEGLNDLETNNPDLAKEWNYEMNGELLPSMVAPQSNKKVWWKCPKCDHSWSAAIYSRNGNKRGCPNCNKKKKAL